MNTIRAKMRLDHLVNQDNGTPPQETWAFVAVSDAPFGPEGQSEDNTYARYTPFGALSMTVTNPDLMGKLQEGQKFYVDLTLAPDSPAFVPVPTPAPAPETPAAAALAVEAAPAPAAEPVATVVESPAPVVPAVDAAVPVAAGLSQEVNTLEALAAGLATPPTAA